MSRFRKPITVLRRKTAGDYDEQGNYKNYSELFGFTALASVQPLSANERQAVEANIDGLRDSRIVKIYTDIELYPKTQETPYKGRNEGDIITWLNRRYIVISCEPYQMDVINHYKAIAREVTEHDE